MPRHSETETGTGTKTGNLMTNNGETVTNCQKDDEWVELCHEYSLSRIYLNVTLHGVLAPACI